jgi:hypothetical protein
MTDERSTYLARVARLYELMAARIGESLDLDQSVEARLRGIVAACFATAHEHEDLVQLAMFDGEAQTEGERKRIGRCNPVVDALQEMLEQDLRAGRIAAVDPARVALLLMGFLRNALAETGLCEDPELAQPIESTTADLLIYWSGVPDAPSLADLSGLEDVFPLICRNLEEAEPFAFSRFGDGELRVIARYAERVRGEMRPRQPTRSHEYFPDLARRLREVLAGEPQYLVGAPPLWFVRYRKELDDLAGSVRWVSSLSFREAFIAGRFAELFDAMSERQVVLVGPSHLGALAARRSWSFQEIPSRDCWLQYAQISGALKEEILASERVFLFCASMVSNVLIDELYPLEPSHTYIDVGSTLDPVCGSQESPVPPFSAELSASYGVPLAFAIILHVITPRCSLGKLRK